MESGKGAADSSDVVIPELFDTLEWVLDSPPSVHQFDEPPVCAFFFMFFILNIENICVVLLVNQIVVEIEHLKNLIIPDDD